MERIKAALHIHDKTPVPGDGGVGNMQNPSASGKNEPTATELWGAGNAETAHHHDHKGDTVAAAAAREAHGTSRPRDNADFINSTSSVQDDAFSRAQNAQHQTSSTNDSLGHRAVAQDAMKSSLAEEKAGSSSTDQFAAIEPRNEIEPSAETGPGSHFRPDTADGVGSTGMGSTGVGSRGVGSTGIGSRGVGSTGVGSAGVGSRGVGSTGIGSRGIGSTGVDSTGTGSTGIGSRGVGSTGVGSTGTGSSGISSTGIGSTGGSTTNSGAGMFQEGHTVFHDAVTGRKPHGLHGESLGE